MKKLLNGSQETLCCSNKIICGISFDNKMPWARYGLPQVAGHQQGQQLPHQKYFPFISKQLIKTQPTYGCHTIRTGTGKYQYVIIVSYQEMHTSLFPRYVVNTNLYKLLFVGRQRTVTPLSTLVPLVNLPRLIQWGTCVQLRVIIRFNDTNSHALHI